MRDVHDAITHREEHTRSQGFSEEVSEIIGGIDVGDSNVESFDHLAHEEVTTVNVLRALVQLRIVREVTCAGVIHVKWDRTGTRLTVFRTEAIQVHGFLGCFGGSHDFGFAR